MSRKPTTRSDRIATERYLRDLLVRKQLRIRELEQQLKSSVVIEPDYYVIITNGWKNKKYGIARVTQVVSPHYIQETDIYMGSYIPCIQFGKFSTKDDAIKKLEILRGNRE